MQQICNDKIFWIFSAFFPFCLYLFTTLFVQVVTLTVERGSPGWKLKANYFGLLPSFDLRYTINKRRPSLHHSAQDVHFFFSPSEHCLVDCFQMETPLFKRHLMSWPFITNVLTCKQICWEKFGVWILVRARDTLHFTAGSLDKPEIIRIISWLCWKNLVHIMLISSCNHFYVETKIE